MVHSPDWLSPNVSDPSALAGNAGTDVEQQNSFLLSNAPTPYNSYTKVLKKILMPDYFNTVCN